MIPRGLRLLAAGAISLAVVAPAVAAGPVPQAAPGQATGEQPGATGTPANDQPVRARENALGARNPAGLNYAPADTALTSEDGIAEPITADKSPGHERLSHPASTTGLVTSRGKIRLSGLVGTSVFNEQGAALGTVADVLVTRSGSAQVIVSVDDHLVPVPWSKLQFNVAGRELQHKVVLPGETRHALDQLPEIRLRPQGSG